MSTGYPLPPPLPLKTNKVIINACPVFFFAIQGVQKKCRTWCVWYAPQNVASFPSDDN